MTVEERLTALETDNAALKELLQNVSRFVFADQTTPVPNLSLNGSRMTYNTSFWSQKPLGQGACVSLAGADWTTLYVETDEIRCHDKASIGTYSAVVAPNPFMQNNIGILGIANNGAVNYGGMFTSGDRTVGFRRQGLELVSGWDVSAVDGRFLIGPVGGPYVQLWPVPKVWP